LAHAIVRVWSAAAEKRRKNLQQISIDMSGYDASALRLSLTALLIVIALEALTHVIVSQQQTGVLGPPLTPSESAEILSVEWDLVFIGIVTLVTSYYSTARSKRDDQALKNLPVASIISVILIIFVYLLWPWLKAHLPWDSLLVRVILTDAVGVGLLGYCIFKARRVRKT
jgi:hypothetical protein